MLKYKPNEMLKSRQLANLLDLAIKSVDPLPWLLRDPHHKSCPGDLDTRDSLVIQ